MHTSHYSRLEKPNIPLATQERLQRSTYHYAYARHARQTQVNWKKETTKRKEKKIKERKGKETKDKKAKKRKREGKGRNFQGKKRQEKQEKTRQQEEARKGKEKGTDQRRHWAHRGYQVHHQWHWGKNATCINHEVLFTYLRETQGHMRLVFGHEPEVTLRSKTW